MLAMFATLLLVAGQPTKGFDYLPKNTTACQYTGASFILKTKWQFNSQSNPIEERDVVQAETNLDTWRSQRLAHQINELSPKIAIDSERLGYRFRGGFRDMLYTHYPWHLAIQHHWPDYFGKDPVLTYRLLKLPTTRQPYYEAAVTAVPSIRCRGKTLEEVQKQLLQLYASYLENLMEEGVSDYDRRDEEVFGESWKAKQLIRSEIKAEIRSNSLETCIDYNRQPWVQFGY